MQTHQEQLLKRIKDRRARVGVVGLGYVGVPLARALVDAGFPVVGFDTDASRVKALCQGSSYLGHFLAVTVQGMLARGFKATTELERLCESEISIICVPTPLGPDRQPDLEFVAAASRAIAGSMKPGRLVILESTTYPGTTRNLVEPILSSSGVKVGIEYFLAYSPEREDPGNPDHGLEKTPKVVGGYDDAALELAVALYRSVAGGVVAVPSLEVAEAAKLLENVYRAVNIALVNELKTVFDRLDIDIWAVIDAAKTKPFGFQSFEPGPGAGGHCIPVDPHYLRWIAQQHGLRTPLIEAATDMNAGMPAWVVAKVEATLGRRGKTLAESRILLLGVAYKKNSDDLRESPGLAIFDLLLQRSVMVRYHDPHVPRIPDLVSRPPSTCESLTLTADAMRSFDAVVVVTDHADFDWHWIQRHSQCLISTRRLPLNDVTYA